MLLEPSGDRSDHRGEEAAGRDADEQAVRELELRLARGAAGQDEPESEPLSAPQPKPAMPMAMKLSVMALDTPAPDQPVASAIGWRRTASENIAPAATQVISAPMATMTQP